MEQLDITRVLNDTVQSILENTDDFAFVKDRHFIYRGASEAFAKDCAGLSGVQDVIGKTDFEIFSDMEIAKKYRTDDEKMFHEGISKVQFREAYPKKDGRNRYCLTTKYLIRDKNGTPIGIFGQCYDITDQIELELINHHDFNRKLAHALNSVFYASYLGNFQDGSFAILRGMDYAKKAIEGNKNIKEAFENFIDKLVKPEDKAKMTDFCNLETLAERLRDGTSVECEYRGNYVEGWCKSSMIPVDYDENGNLTHFMFVISSVDKKKASELEENISNKKNLEAIFDKVPGGIIMYKWDGKKLHTINISKFYEDQYGSAMVNGGGPDFSRVHPDDVDNYKKAILNAINHTHTLEYVYRVWNQKKERYLWTQINAVSELQPDGTSLVYAMYSDVTRQKEAELMVEKQSASLVSALNASKQLCYEYDPETHVEECLTEDNIFHFPRIIENYPEAMLEIVHPEDQNLFLSTIHTMDQGGKDASCTIRLKEGDKYVWYTYQLHSMYDYEKERIVVLLSIMNNFEHITALQSYRQQMNGLLNLTKDTLTFGSVNITEDTFKVVHAENEILKIFNECSSLWDVFKRCSEYVVGKAQQAEYRRVFSKDNLLNLAKQGHMKVQMDHLYRMKDRMEWVRTSVDMLENPTTGDITGVSYAKSIQQEKIKDEILENILQEDYLVVALINASNGNYYFFNKRTGEFCVHKKDYWGQLKNIHHGIENENLKEYLSKENVLKTLEKKKECVNVFYVNMNGTNQRIESRYTYVDKEHGMMLMLLRNITDAALVKKYKYDSEHDLVTGLLNRKAVFEKCRKLLNEHPDQQFVMLHGDIKNFRLYNSFFGEEEGNRLLCSIADQFRIMDKDYEYWAFGRIEADVFCAFFPMDEDLFRKHIHYLLKEIPNKQNDFLVEPNIGVYIVQDPTMPIEAMFTRATIAAKSGVKNLFDPISIFDSKMEQKLKDDQNVIQDMKKAIAEEQFQVYLQPKYSLRTEKMVGSEALVRWIHPVHGMISPGKFIPVFESNGYIAKLDHYMWEHVCMILKKWKDEGKPIFPVSVNVSRISMYSQGTVEFLKNLVTKYEIEPKYLELELTETAYMDDPDEIKNQLRELQEFGFHILMDDFGSGYSSLNTLRELPVDILKLDMKFLSTSNEDIRGNIVLSSVIRMSKYLKLPIVAEGVETSEQAIFLRSLGCEYVQGYLFARPMPVADYEALLPENTECCEQEEIVDLEQVYKHLTIETGMLESVLPIPAGFLEYNDGTFSFLRLNKSFMNEFHLNENIEPVSIIFQKHMEQESYDRMLRAFEDCTESRKGLTFRFFWNSDSGQRTEYSAKIFFEGRVGNQANMVITLMNISDDLYE